MLTFHSPLQDLHAPEYEFYRGDRVPCFESPSRAAFILDELRNQGYDLRIPDHDSWQVLKRIHSAAYLTFLNTAWVQWLELDATNENIQPFPSVWPIRTLRSDIEPNNFIAKLGLYSMDNGTPLTAGTWSAIKAGADAAVSAAKYLAQGNGSVFCATRPPGHHAGSDFMGGYCFLNNAAVAAQELLDSGCQRVAILDVDFHHGNGTQSIFYERNDVFFASLHGDPRSEYPFYLGHSEETGSGQGAGFNLNLPMAAGIPAGDWFDALDTALTKIKSVAARTLVVSLGLDTFADDPISNFALQSSDFIKLGKRLREEGLPTLFILEGGYATDQLGTNVANVLDAFK